MKMSKFRSKLYYVQSYNKEDTKTNPFIILNLQIHILNETDLIIDDFNFNK